jgi:6-pyruvoyltetrahydropterin/6-carboxytetrahydropterin synthase
MLIQTGCLGLQVERPFLDFASATPRLVRVDEVYELIIKEDFAAAHRLLNYRGSCEKLHGHNFKVEILVRAKELDPIGLALDFSELKEITRKVLASFDHTVLNELAEFQDQNPSAENISRCLFSTLASAINSERVRLCRVTVWESERAAASYFVE